ncbi:hypothetical protein SAMN04487783_0851 [Agrococcus baldri]|uniref:MT0933-like antitoxin protein n=1 Tax=Agrococcus baldri TaxID=153730 RepID=A0AA94HLD3_9MICO|nr:hypothetical protein [Agrococcus baldri]SFS06604.1 hypothetical protein SAMN04487783_0851 [Agrococcus baldri]
MGILDDAKDKLGDAAGWVKDRAEQIGDQAQDAGQTIGGKAADAKHWVESRVGGSDAGNPTPEARSGGGGEFATDWVDVSTDDSADAPQADAVEPGAEGDRNA